MTKLPDIEQLRAETSGCAINTYFNHSGASLPTNATVAAVTDHLQREALHGGMDAAAAVADRIEKARADAAALVGATPGEIAFTTSGSAGFGLVFAALPPLRSGDRILVGRQEWGGNLATMRAAADRVGALVEAIPCCEDGSVDATALTRMIDERVRLISLTWLPANGGLINDAEAVGRVARAAGVPYFVDAGQALGQIPVDVSRIGCDMLKGTARKYLRGPRGTALLYVRSDFLPRLTPAFLDVQSGPWTEDGPRVRTDARRFETVEGSIALQLGMAEALRHALEIGVEPVRTRIVTLAADLRTALADIKNVSVRDLGTQKSGLVSFTIAGIAAPDVRTRLAAEHISVGANGVPYTPLDMKARGLDGIVRASVSYFNTEDEIAGVAAAVAALARSAS
jgi:cysteine desulfurase/selenocysteine lyase